MPIQPGARLGPYEIVTSLGSGGMGEVYEAHDTRLDRRVAIKVLAPHLLHRGDALDRFEREAKAIAALSHPNVVAIFDIGREEERRYVVTELLEGETLRTTIAGSEIPWRHAVSLALGACQGLAAAHAKGIVHRDIKPENIFITNSGLVKILDFGLARLDQGHASLPSGEETIVKTPDGQVMGTVGYMSPEQVRGEVAESASDLFSLGCVLYEMVTGRRPFSRPNAAETMHAILKDIPPALGSQAEVSTELESVVLHCLEKDPHRRFQSAGDLALALQALLSSTEAGKTIAVRRAKQIASLAVLPFGSSPGDAEAELFADSLTDQVINAMSSTTGLRVVTRSRVSRFKSATLDPQDAGRQLNVSIILTGRVARLAESWTVQAELASVADASQLWGQQFRGKSDNPLDLAASLALEIAESVCQRLEVKPAKRGGKKKARATARSLSSDSLHEVSTARSHAAQATGESLRKASELLQQVIQRAPDHPLAHAYLADCYLDLALHSFVPPEEVRAKAKSAAAKAIECGPDSSEAYAAHGMVQAYLEWQWDGAKESLVRAMELNPEDATTQQRHAEVLLLRGSVNESMRETASAAARAPGSAAIADSASHVLYLGRRFDEAFELAHRAAILRPESVRPRITMAMTSAQGKLLAEAAEELQKASRLYDDDLEVSAALGCVYAMWRKQAGAAKIADKLLNPSRPRYVAPYLIARIDALSGASDRMFTLLDRAYSERSPYLAYLRVDPAFDAVRYERRFLGVLERLGLE